MSANIETMMYTGREVPWHGLGVQVEEAPNSKDAITLAGLDWKVESRPIYNNLGQEIPGWYANTRDKDNTVLGMVSKKYQIVQNEDAFAFTDSLLNNGMVYETAGSLRNGKQVWLLGKMPETTILDDKIEPYVCFTNSFDGTGSVRVCLTPVRVVCNNTLNFALKTAKRSWSTRHLGNVQNKLEEARNTLGLTEMYLQELNKNAIELANKIVTDAELSDIIDHVFEISTEDSQRKIDNMNYLKFEFYRCYNMSDIEKFKGTAWGIVNAATDMADHSVPNRLTQNYQANNWGKILNGHPLVDLVYECVA